MSSEAQINANRENAQHSTGPKTDEGKANSSHNNFRHGFRGKFVVLPSESQEEFDALLDNLRAEHRPQCTVEDMLILKMAQHFWLSQRAQMLADLSMDPQAPDANPDKLFPLWLRYQTTNDRAFHKCLDQLLKLRAQRVKEAIGFERQQREENAQAQKLSRERERHNAAKPRKPAVRLSNPASKNSTNSRSSSPRLNSITRRSSISSWIASIRSLLLPPSASCKPKKPHNPCQRRRNRAASVSELDWLPARFAYFSLGLSSAFKSPSAY